MLKKFKSLNKWVFLTLKLVQSLSIFNVILLFLTMRMNTSFSRYMIIWMSEKISKSNQFFYPQNFSSLSSSDCMRDTFVEIKRHIQDTYKKAYVVYYIPNFWYYVIYLEVVLSVNTFD